VVGLAMATAYWISLGAVISTGDDSGVDPALPRIVAGYTGSDEPVTEGERAMLPLDTVFAKKTYSFLDDEITCQIVLSGGEKRSIHRPEICLPGQGWTIRGGQALPIPLADGRTMKVMHLQLQRSIPLGPDNTRDLQSHFLYWFVGRNRVTPYHHERVLLSSWDRVFHSTNHRWAYVIISANVYKGFRPGGKDSEQTLEMLKKFVPEILPYFHKPEVTATIGR